MTIINSADDAVTKEQTEHKDGLVAAGRDDPAGDRAMGPEVRISQGRKVVPGVADTSEWESAGSDLQAKPNNANPRAFTYFL